MKEKTILELFQETESSYPIGTGRTSDVYIFDNDPRLFSYVLRIRHDEGDSLAFLNSTTSLTPLKNDFEGRNYGQPILNAYGVSLNLKKGHSFGEIQNYFNGKKLNENYYKKFEESRNIKNLILKLEPDSFYKLADELSDLTRLGKGVDPIGDNLVITLDNHLGFIDTDGNVKNNKPNTVKKMIPFFDLESESKFNAAFTAEREREREKYQLPIAA